MPAASFAHVLDRLIDARAGSSSTASTAGILTAPLLGAPHQPAYTVHIFRSAEPPPRRRRRLTARQRAALETLRRHGASIDDAYERAELKSAFRELARGLHPDMHPHASAEDREWLAGAFREARDAYAALLAHCGGRD